MIEKLTRQEQGAVYAGLMTRIEQCNKAMETELDNLPYWTSERDRAQSALRKLAKIEYSGKR